MRWYSNYYPIRIIVLLRGRDESARHEDATRSARYYRRRADINAQ